MTTRQCEFCKDWTTEYLEECYGVCEMECGACNGTKELDSRDCFCHAYAPSECSCNADWSDYIDWEDLE